MWQPFYGSPRPGSRPQVVFSCALTWGSREGISSVGSARQPGAWRHRPPSRMRCPPPSRGKAVGTPRRCPPSRSPARGLRRQPGPRGSAAHPADLPAQPSGRASPSPHSANHSVCLSNVNLTYVPKKTWNWLLQHIHTCMYLCISVCTHTHTHKYLSLVYTFIPTHVLTHTPCTPLALLLGRNPPCLVLRVGALGTPCPRVGLSRARFRARPLGHD